ncbi:TPA: JAB domain-containing protein, partial [Escherichia coli]
MTFIASDRSGHYQTLEPVTREQIIRFAHSLLTRQFRNRRKITSSEDVRQWLVMKLALENRESFGVIMLSQQHHILGYQTLFTGTLSQTMVYPREIVSLALTHN